MRFVSRRPRLAELRPWVSAVWFCTGAAVSESVLPAGRAHLVMRLGGGPHAGVLHGPASRPRPVGAPAPDESFVGVVFRAGGTRPFFGAPAGELADLSIPLPELWGRDGVGRIDAGTGPASVLDRIEAGLLARHRHAGSGPARLTVDAQRELHAGAGVATVAARCGVDRRALGTAFRRDVGFGVKHYARLLRFERAVRAVRAVDAPSLSHIAAQLSFADQSHLTREFGYFAGIAPGRLHRRPGPTPLHVVHDEMFKTPGTGPGTLPP